MEKQRWASSESFFATKSQNVFAGLGRFHCLARVARIASGGVHHLNSEISPRGKHRRRVALTQIDPSFGSCSGMIAELRRTYSTVEVSTDSWSLYSRTILVGSAPEKASEARSNRNKVAPLYVLFQSDVKVEPFITSLVFCCCRLWGMQYEWCAFPVTKRHFDAQRGSYCTLF